METETYIKAPKNCPSTNNSKDSLEKAEKVVKAPRNPIKRKGIKYFSRLESIKL